MLQTADGNGDPLDLPHDRVFGQRLVGVIRRDARHPLHDVERAERGFEAEVATFGELARVGRVEGELALVEVADADLL